MKDNQIDYETTIGTWIVMIIVICLMMIEFAALFIFEIWHEINNVSLTLVIFQILVLTYLIVEKIYRHIKIKNYRNDISRQNQDGVIK